MRADSSNRSQPHVGAPKSGHAFHMFCSENNAGAADLAREVATELKLEVLLTSDPDQMCDCDCMLLHLTSLTWTQGQTSLAFADEIEKAMENELPLLLTHESESRIYWNQAHAMPIYSASCYGLSHTRSARRINGMQQ